MKQGPALFKYEKTDLFEDWVVGDNALFESRTRLFVFAACVGFNRSHFVDDPAETGEIRWNYIAQNPRLSLAAASISYAHTDDPSVILDPKRQIEILTGYGAGGARILEREVQKSPGNPLDNMISFLQDYRDDDQVSAQVDILQNIEQEISSLQHD